MTRSVPAAPSPRGEPAPRKGWNTLQLLRGMRVVLLLFDFVLLLVILNAATEGHSALRWITDRGVPALVSAERIQVSLERMEDTSTREVLQRPGRGSALRQTYEDRRSETVRALMQAAQSSPDETVGESSLETIQLGLGTYEQLIGVSRDLHIRGEHAAANSYLEATYFMQGRLLPVSRTVKTLEVTRLTNSFEKEQRRISTARALFVAFFVLELGLLFAVQLSLSRRTHRILNPALAVGTLLLVVAGIHIATSLHAEEDQLGRVQTESLNAVQNLWTVREFAYQADLDLGLDLATSAQKTPGARAFDRDSAQVASTPLTLTPEQLAEALRESRSVAGFSGLLAEEIAREGSSEEHELLLSGLSAWQTYLKQSQQIQRLQASGQAERAVQLYEGVAGEQPGDTLAHFDGNVEAALRDRQALLNTSLGESLSALSRLELEAGLVSAVLAALVLLGFQPRLREYR